MSTIEKIKEEIAIEELLTSNKELILFNDEVNTFDHVIDTLIRICNHDLIQAEQCAMLVHYKGKCSVKTGSYEELEPMCTGLLDAGLSAEIQ
ncbi:MAG TPA: ATP-dependent Clp protease adaptor ClpS [Flavobacterium sp.]|nr:ATP-dependent Clp protease adaptor ClpS [Flavobacterium sp.]